MEWLKPVLLRESQKVAAIVESKPEVVVAVTKQAPPKKELKAKIIGGYVRNGGDVVTGG